MNEPEVPVPAPKGPIILSEIDGRMMTGLMLDQKRGGHVEQLNRSLRLYGALGRFMAAYLLVAFPVLLWPFESGLNLAGQVVMLLPAFAAASGVIACWVLAREAVRNITMLDDWARERGY